MLRGEPGLQMVLKMGLPGNALAAGWGPRCEAIRTSDRSTTDRANAERFPTVTHFAPYCTGERGISTRVRATCLLRLRVMHGREGQHVRLTL